MSFHILKGKSKADCVQLMEQVISGDMRLNVLVAKGLSVIPAARWKSATANCLETPMLKDVEYVNDSYHNWCWLASDAPDFTEYSSSEKLVEVVNSKQMAIAIIGDWVIRSAYEVLNENSEICFVIRHSHGKRSLDGANVIGASQINFPTDNLALSPATYADKANQYPINTPEFAAVIEVWEKYWKDGSGMKQEAIVAELMANGRFLKKRAEAIEMICRPENARRGGHKKK